ncbi:MAG: ribosomal L27e protein family-domain-containing protein [Olpidium bornovanus]|uniref:60S ribosomal protein L27 n=1 Tax=Olpidium bornovanus TaxID=278681 RepID=A0A8H8DMG7_9FUNG|nr:MAG: ribosomal L27e protein family-domain-containing protein [Olpidium bornovanus]
MLSARFARRRHHRTFPPAAGARLAAVCARDELPEHQRTHPHRPPPPQLTCRLRVVPCSLKAELLRRPFDPPFQVVVVLQGRYAGKKAVVLKNYDEGTKERKYGHAIVAGIERYPLPITRRTGKKKAARRSRIKPFIKAVNYNHVMPTRYGIEVDQFKQAVTPETFKEPTQRVAARRAIKKLFEERYTSGKNTWFFEKLRF